MSPTDLLTLHEAASAQNLTPEQFSDRIARRKSPAPTRFIQDPITGSLTPYWDITPRNVPTTNKEQHLRTLVDELRYYLWQNGHLAITTHTLGRNIATGGAYRLGAHLTSLRANYRMGKLDPTLIATLEELPGWGWDYTDTQWKARFTRVLSTWPNLTKNDRSWLGNQKRRYPKLRADWKRLLDTHPHLNEKVARSRVESFVEAAHVWLDANPGHTMYSLPYNATITFQGTTYMLGRRATYYRRRWAGLEGTNPLSQYDVARIETLPGWDWDVSPRHRLAALKRHDLQHLPHVKKMRKQLSA